MTTEHSPLNVRGIFAYPRSNTPYFVKPVPLESFVTAFPLTDEHVVLVTKKSVHLLFLPNEEILWSLFVADPISTAALSPNHQFLALAFPQAIVLWDLCRGSVKLQVEIAPDESVTLLFDPKSTLLAFSLFENGVQLWDIASGHHVRTLVAEKGSTLESPKSLAFSPDGKLLAVGNIEMHETWLWQVEDGEELQMLEEHPWRHRLWGLVFSPDGRWLIGSEWSTDPEEESMSIWEIPGGRRVQGLPHMGWLPAFSQDGTSLASMNYDGVFLWHFAERKLLWQRGAGSWDGMAFSPSGQMLVCHVSESIDWWDVVTGQHVYTLKRVNVGRIGGLFSPHGHILATRLLTGTVQLWDTTAGQVQFQVPFSYPQIKGCAPSPSGKQVVLWEDGTREALPPLHVLVPDQEIHLRWRLPTPFRIACAACQETAGWLAVGGVGGHTSARSILLWDVPATPFTEAEALASEPRYRFIGHTGNIRCMQFSPTGDVLASSADDQTVRLWQTRTGDVGPVLHGHTQTVTCLAFHEPSNWVLSGSRDGTVRIWDRVNGQSLQVLEGSLGPLVAIAVSEDGQHIAALDDKQTLRVWSASEPLFATRTIMISPSLQAHRAFTLQGAAVAPESQQEGMHFWTYGLEEGASPLIQDRVQPLGVAFQPDRTLLVAGYCWGPTHLWGLAEVDGGSQIL